MDDRILEVVATEVARRLARQHTCGHDETSDAAGPATASDREPAQHGESGVEVVTVGVSGHHVHLSQADCEALFGPGCQLTVQRTLTQPGQFAARETVTMVGPKGSIPHMRIVGPVRPHTQVEITRTDGFTLGIDAPVRVSGDIRGSAACVLVGPRGAVLLDEGVIVAARHLHLEPDRAAALGLVSGDTVEVSAGGERPGILSRIIVRAGLDHKAEIHVDTDEANALGLNHGQALRVNRRGPA